MRKFIYQSASRNSSLHISDKKPLEGFHFKIKYVGEKTIVNIIICQNMMMMTDMLCRRHAIFMMKFIWMPNSIKIFYLSPKSQNCHQHIRCPRFVTNIDVTISALWPMTFQIKLEASYLSKLMYLSPSSEKCRFYYFRHNCVQSEWQPIRGVHQK